MATAIVTKYSVANTVPDPGALLDGELAYSFPSANLFIGSGGTYEIIGGKYYTDIINNRSANSTPSTIVVRDSVGRIYSNVFVSTETATEGFIGNLAGIARSANGLHEGVLIEFGGDLSGNVFTDFTTNVSIDLPLSNTGVTEGIYGDALNVPVITVDSKGRIVSSRQTPITFVSPTINLVYEHANAAFEAANSLTPEFNESSYNHANAAYEHANAAYILALTPDNVSNTAIDLALDAARLARYSSNVANSVNVTSTTINTVFDQSNTAYLLAAYSANTANVSLDLANAALFQTTNVNERLLSTANVAATAERISFEASDRSNATATYANAAYDLANTKYASSGGTISGNVYITGNLTVAGNVSYIATNELKVGDSLITLNAELGPSVAPTENAGLEIERGSAANTLLLWNETIDKWTFTNDGTNYSNIGSSSAEAYANASFEIANAAFATSFQSNTKVQYAFDKANGSFSSLNTHIQLTTSNFANTSNSINLLFAIANTPSEYVNTISNYANAAFEAANSLSPEFNQSSFDKANAAYDHSNLVFLHANASFGFANSISNQSVAGSVYANAAYRHANSAFNQANLNFIFANSAYFQTNTATLIALAAYAKANTVISLASGQLAFDAANDASRIAVTSGDYANSAFTLANNISLSSIDGYSRPHSNAAFIQANAAFDLTNTKFSSSGGSITGDVSLTGNLTIQGSSVVVSVPSLSVEDNIIDLAAETVGTPTQPAGIRVIRGDENPVQFRWNEVLDRWTFTNDGTTYSSIASSAAEVYANAAYVHANTANQRAVITGDYANAAFDAANLAFTAGGTIAGGYANSAYLHANAAYTSQNSTGIYANTAFESQNATGNYANAAFDAANLAFTAGGTIAGGYANSAFGHANAAYVSQNTTGIYANAAYELANTKFASVGGTVSGDVTVSGNLTVVGQTTYANTEKVLIADNILTLNAAIGQSLLPVSDAGLEIDRGFSQNVYLIWSENDDRWKFTNDGTSYSFIASAASESYANSAYLHANASYVSQNTTGVYANTAFTSQNTTGVYANAAYAHANAAYVSQNTTGVYANTAFTSQNTTGVYANVAFTSQNTTGIYANAAFAHANGSFTSQNTSGLYANNAYAHANASYASQNLTGNYANSSYFHANAAYERANVGLNTLTGGSISGPLTVGGNFYVSGDFVKFADSIITLNADIGQEANPNENAGLEVDRGFAANVFILWDENSDKWAFTNDGTNYSFISSAAAEVYANAAFTSQNTTGVYANAAFTAQNTTGVYANVAFTSQNTTGVYANTAFVHANAAYVSQNTTGVYANAAFDQANTKLGSSGGTIDGDLTVTGNLTISGNVTTVSANNLVIEDNMFYLNDGSTITNPDLGFAGNYNDGEYAHAGLFRDASDGIWKFYDSYTPEPDESPYIDTTHVSFRIANLTANLITNVISVRGYDPLNHANNIYFHANASYIQANTATDDAAQADQRAVTSGLYGNNAYAHANSSYTAANTALNDALAFAIALG